MYVPEKISPKIRSKIMSSIKSKNTRPEIAVRRLLWKSGKRYRIHDSTVAGNPDISNKRRKIAIFVDGCFWHGCNKCYVSPKTNIAYWDEKIIRNAKRRTNVLRSLLKENWAVVQIWEHEIKEDQESVLQKIELAWQNS